MAHDLVPEAEEVLDKEFPVLDHGFVRLVDYMGSDSRIVQAARVSYGAGTKSFRQDRGLINYLLRNEHTSPFEQVVFTFHAKMPIFVARQWVRHRTARLNEISGRYSVMPDEFYVPDPALIARQSADNKQGREVDPIDSKEAEEVRERFRRGQIEAYRDYEALIEEGIAREVARMNLPLSLYTEWYWQIDLHNLFRFLALRLDPHAQAEIRAYARVLSDLAARVCPIAFEAFEEHIRDRVVFSRTERQALDRLTASAGDDDILEAARAAGLSQKEIERFLAKLRRG